MPDSFIPLEDMKEVLGLSPDQDADDMVIQRKVEAAEDHINRMLGFQMRVRYPAPADDPVASTVPASLREAVVQLAAWWFENREAVTDMSRELPFGVREIVTEYREWTF